MKWVVKNIQQASSSLLTKNIASLILASVMTLGPTAEANPSPEGMDLFINGLLKQMTVEEKIGQLTQFSADMAQTGGTLRTDYIEEIAKGRVGSVLNAYTPKFTRDLQQVVQDRTRLKIPLIFGFDVVHGHRTIFPIPLAESSTWDLDAIHESARISAKEAAADGVHWTFAPMVDISRDPRWGRVAEGSGEDSWLGAKIAEARVRGFQGTSLLDQSSVLATVKHLAAYGAPIGGRDYQVVDMSERELLEVYFPPYEAAVRAGVGSAMTAFNEISGIPSTSNTWLLTDVLRKTWNFVGFIVTDYTAINELVHHGVATDNSEASLLAFQAGVDMDMQGGVFNSHLPNHLAEKRISMQDLDTSVRRVLEAKYKLGLFTDPNRGATDDRATQVLMAPEHLAKARDIARRSIVLLKNDNKVLPLKKSSTIALIGPMAANQRDLIGNWSAAGDWSRAVSMLQGMTEAASEGRAHILYAKGANVLEDRQLISFLNKHGGDITLDSRSPQAMIDEAVAIAKQSEVVVAALGETQGMSGEGASRTQIRLPENQVKLLEALHATGKPIVLVLMNGRPLALERENQLADAIVETWFLGTQAGPAITDVLFGNYNPSGKLTMTFPVNEGQIPIYYSQKNTGRPSAGPSEQKYESKYIDAPNEPLFPFGWGLSYTDFVYSEPQLSTTRMAATDELTVAFTVRNTGTVDGEETAQLYIRDLVASVTRPLKELRGFEKVFLKAGESKTVTMKLTINDLAFYGRDLRKTVEPGDFEVMVGGNSSQLKKARLTLLPVNHQVLSQN